MPEIAKKVTLDLAKKKLFVDGAEFPWLISKEGPSFGGDMDGPIRRITLTFFADDLEVIPADS